MSKARPVFLGTDSGATTAKTGGIFRDGELVSRSLRQSPTNAEFGTAAVVEGWINGAEGFLGEHGLGWDDVAGVGLAMPGPFRAPGVLGLSANLPASFDGWDFQTDYAAALARAAGRPVPLVSLNDGHCGGIAEARFLQREQPGSCLLVAPGSGLGCAMVMENGELLSGAHDSAGFLCHAPAPFHLLGLPRFTCGCGRDWGCAEAYTTISGLPQYLDWILPRYPDHPLARSSESPKVRALALRGLAQDGDPLAMEIFDLQARALGHAVAAATLLLDPAHVVIGGGLMDPGSTTDAFRDRFLRLLRESAESYLWVEPGEITFSAARLGELSQAIGVALLARDHEVQQATADGSAL